MLHICLALGAVCWKDKDFNSWKNASVFLGKNKEIIDAELWAIADGLETARKTTSNNLNTYYDFQRLTGSAHYTSATEFRHK